VNKNKGSWQARVGVQRYIQRCIQREWLAGRLGGELTEQIPEAERQGKWRTKTDSKKQASQAETSSYK